VACHVGPTWPLSPSCSHLSPSRPRRRRPSPVPACGRPPAAPPLPPGGSAPLPAPGSEAPRRRASGRPARPLLPFMLRLAGWVRARRGGRPALRRRSLDTERHHLRPKRRRLDPRRRSRHRTRGPPAQPLVPCGDLREQGRATPRRPWPPGGGAALDHDRRAPCRAGLHRAPPPRGPPPSPLCPAVRRSPLLLRALPLRRVAGAPLLHHAHLHLRRAARAACGRDLGAQRRALSAMAAVTSLSDCVRKRWFAVRPPLTVADRELRRASARELRHGRREDPRRSLGGRREAARRREAWRDRARSGGEVVRRRGRSSAAPRPPHGGDRGSAVAGRGEGGGASSAWRGGRRDGGAHGRRRRRPGGSGLGRERERERERERLVSA